MNNLDEITKDLRYVVLKGIPNQTTENHRDYSTLYSYWKNFWNDHFKKVESNEKLDPLDFFRQEKITALMCGDEVIGMHLYSYYHLNCKAEEHPYFNAYKPEFINELLSRDCYKIQAMQYFMVNPDWSPRRTGILYSAVLASLGLKHQENEGADCSITLARKDIGASTLAEKLNFFEVLEPIEMHNSPIATSMHTIF